jgi:Domain of unknown function (DUF4386)
MKTDQKKIARIAGILYLINAITGAIGIIIVPGKLIVPNDIAATAQNIINNEFLFRVGILSSISCQIVFIFLALTLFNLFENVSRNLTRTLLTLVVVSVPVTFYIIFNQLEAFMILQNNFMTSIELIQKQELAMSKLQIYQDGIVLVGVFWGLWLIPFGQLVYKSGFIPKVLGVFLIVGGSSYLLDVCVFILIPEFHRQTNILVTVISSIAEVSMVVWLLIKGIKMDNETPIISKTH